LNKKIVIPVMALLVLFVVAPVMAAPATKTPFTAAITLTFLPTENQWITEDGIYHVKEQVAEGTVTGDVSGEMQLVRHMILDLNTGEGSCHGKFVVTVDGGTFEGSEQSEITNYAALPDGISGTLVAHGTGDYVGLKMMGSFEGGLIEENIVQATLEGIILSPTE